MPPSIKNEQGSTKNENRLTVPQGTTETNAPTKNDFLIHAPVVNLPKSGGAIHGIGEKFSANPVTGTGSMSIPIATSPGRAGFGPQLSLSYDSGAGNGPFGLGWHLSLPNITRKTDKGLPRYGDVEESDIFILSGAEDLVPVFKKNTDDSWTLDSAGNFVIHEEELDGYRVRRYRPRVEGLFARIERWTNLTDPTNVHWRSISKDNILTLYGLDASSRIADPQDATRIFSWLICETRDDKGNAILYQYKSEDGTGVDMGAAHEQNRGPPDDIRRTANRYIKRIQYGNRKTLLVNNQRPRFLTQSQIANADWMFEVVFDYGEHYREDTHGNVTEVNITDDQHPWDCRPDTFSSYRAGFEVRTYRLCQRVLMFHHFPELEQPDYLVRATQFHHTPDPILTKLNAVTQSGYEWFNGAYQQRSLPPVNFFYSIATIQNTIEEVDPDSVMNLPQGLDGGIYQWVDLDGEGLSGILTQQGDAWHYKRNVSALPVKDSSGTPVTRARFEPLETLRTVPSPTNLSGGQQLLDLAGDGQLDVVEFDRPTPGFFERTFEGGWETFQPFTSVPNVNWQDPNLKFLDLTGDGHADLVITEEEAFVWHASLAEAGFGPAQRTVTALNEDEGPRLVFADVTQSIYLADMSGDGLTDIVRIRNGEVCYWPNIGYGRFGAKVSMDNAPWFDAPDIFHQRRIRLTDVDGSGVTDIIYIHQNGPRVYFNQSGNGWSGAVPIASFPRIDDVASIQALDLLGIGTACLVWSSSLPADAPRIMRYIDLMGGQKPHLLTSVDNNLGAQTEIEYTPSTKFYLQDQRDGKPWVTRLPFPVQCVERVSVIDQWRKTRFSTTYSYHHGYFDGVEREFRGFGRVEQLDCETFDKSLQDNHDSPYITDDLTLYQPPIKTVTWFHTGFAAEQDRVLGGFAHEYFQLPDFTEHALPHPQLEDSDATAQEWREAARACKGMVLRQEVFELDVNALSQGEHKPVRLYTTAYHNSRIQRLQPVGSNRYGVFMVTESEAITYHYELDLTQPTLEHDPRIAHTLNLNIDQYGNVLDAVAAVYPRIGRHSDGSLNSAQLELIYQVQQERHCGMNSIRYTQDIDNGDNYRLRVPCEVQTWDVTGLTPDGTGGAYFTLKELQTIDLPGTGINEISYHQVADGKSVQKRLVECVRTLFFADDLSGSRELGEQGPLGLVYEHYKLALTQGLLDAVLVDSARLTLAEQTLNAIKVIDNKTHRLSGYYKGNDLFANHTITPESLDQQYWQASGRAGFNSNTAHNFYIPDSYTDSFGNTTQLTYDENYLLITSSKDAKDNKSGIFLIQKTDVNGNLINVPRIDYRVLAPIELVDINGNHSEVAFDVLGLTVAAATKGKLLSNSQWEGDNLDGFENFELRNPTAVEVVQFCTNTTTNNNTAKDWLGNATTRFVYHFGEGFDNNTGNLQLGKKMPGACGILREKHVGQLKTGETSPLQVALECSDGGGNVVMKKVQAEPDPDTKATRWIVNGLTLLNNKGKPVKQYEPAFSDSFGCESPQANGVSTTTYYDAVGRIVRVEMPDGTFSRVEFTPWYVKSYDQNDTAYDPNEPDISKQGEWYRRRMDQNHPRFAEFGTTENQRAAILTQQHAKTPAEVHLDSLGREVISIAHNRTPDSKGDWQDEKYFTFTKLDAEGKPLWIVDARGNKVMQYITPPQVTHTPLSNQTNSDWHDAYTMPTSAAPCYDIAGNLLYQYSMDAGERWMINDAAGKPMVAWDINETPQGNTSAREARIYTTDYDALHRPTALWISNNGNPRQMIERYVYQDADATDTNNLNGQLTKHYDPSGLLQTIRRDFKGNLQEVQRRLNNAPEQSVIDWQTNPDSQLETDTNGIPVTYTQITEHDALNRITRLENWHLQDNMPAVYLPLYNERGVLVSESLNVRGAVTKAIGLITYNAKGQKLKLILGNGTTTTYTYDASTFRLTTLRTVRAINPNGLQQLEYTYDPVGNITHIHDEAQDTVFFDNTIIRPEHHYVYDAIYRLIEGSGRENANYRDAPSQFDPQEMVNFPTLAANAMRNYTQHYRYDSVGNIMQMKHEVTATTGAWTRDFIYACDDPSQPASNRLLSTTQGNTTINYLYDAHGNMLNTANVAPGQHLQWDHRDMIKSIDLIGGGIAYYQYDSAKQRTRKCIVNQNNKGYWERIYLGGYERYRRYSGNGTTLVEEIETHHLFEGEQRVLMVDNVIKTNKTHSDGTKYKPQAINRYQYSNHLGSACLELDHKAAIISYEEYHPYGTSAYLAKQTDSEAPAKRYRYTGMERDEESGLNYHTARHYLPWIGRWGSCDPIGIRGCIDCYTFCENNPLSLKDTTGLQPNKSAKSTWMDVANSGKGFSLSDLNFEDKSATYNPKPAMQEYFKGMNISVEQSAQVGGLIDALIFLNIACLGSEKNIAQCKSWVQDIKPFVYKKEDLKQATKYEIIWSLFFTELITLPLGVEDDEVNTTRSLLRRAEVANSSGLSAIEAGAQNPSIKFIPNSELGLPERSAEDVLRIAEENGVVFPEAVRIVPNKNMPTGVKARYGPQVADRNALIFYDNENVPSRSLVTYKKGDPEGSILIEINPDILKSDEEIVATLAHEKYEIGQLQTEFLSNANGAMTATEYARRVSPGIINYHDAAWEYADLAVISMRLRRALLTPNK